MSLEKKEYLLKKINEKSFELDRLKDEYSELLKNFNEEFSGEIEENKK